MNPKPYNLDPKPETLNPKPETQNPKPETLMYPPEQSALFSSLLLSSLELSDTQVYEPQRGSCSTSWQAVLAVGRSPQVNCEMQVDF